MKENISSLSIIPHLFSKTNSRIGLALSENLNGLMAWPVRWGIEDSMYIWKNNGMWPCYCCTIGYREYIEENARNFPVLERKGEWRQGLFVIGCKSIELWNLWFPYYWQPGLCWQMVESRMLYVGIQESVLLHVWLLFSFKADHKAARMVMPFSAQDGAILADYRSEAECSILATGKNAKAD